eukprot:TRINITY_DN7039_c0_g3_i8.p1 TRINITY_DN7039_c0_g3~~TRINITY_DN7039_c0_g3_i8.p1  ORF type:complete len:229 (+),score=38.38 TRINITY_DN7039_c0_g3_i8:157-843(+)
MEQSTLSADTGKVSIKNFLFCIPVKSAYAYTCCCITSVAQGVELFCCFCIYLSFQTAVLLVTFHVVENEEIDVRIVFRCMQILYGVFAVLTLYGIEKDKLTLVKTYYYVKIVELIVTAARYTLMVMFGKCTDSTIMNSLKEFCFTSTDAAILVISVLLTLYEAFLLFSFINLVTLGEASKVMHDRNFEPREPLPSADRGRSLEEKTEKTSEENREQPFEKVKVDTSNL